MMISLTMTVILLTAAFVLLCAIGAYSLWLHSRLLNRLKSAHNLLWIDLGAPRLPKILFQWSYQNNLRITGQRIMYVGWLRDKYYEQLQDPEVTLLALRLGWMFWIFIASALALIGAGMLWAQHMQAR